jgi:prophage maintenance system killer protein
VRLFLSLNGMRLQFDKMAAVMVMEQFAAGALSEAKLAAWLRARLAE